VSVVCLCLICLPYVSACCVCLVCRPCASALYVWRLCWFRYLHRTQTVGLHRLQSSLLLVVVLVLVLFVELRGGIRMESGRREEGEREGNSAGVFAGRGEHCANDLRLRDCTGLPGAMHSCLLLHKVLLRCKCSPANVQDLMACAMYIGTGAAVTVWQTGERVASSYAVPSFYC